MSLLYRRRGSISLFLLVILLPMFTFAGFMIDISNCFLAKAAAEGAGELALNTALAEYDSVLKETYGLFAMSQHGTSDNDALCERLLDHFGSALGPEGLFGVSLNNFLVSPVAESSLANPEVLEKGIVEFMKYRGPAGVAQSLLGSLEAFRKLGERTTVAEKKMAVEKELGDLSGTLAEFYGAIQKLDEVQTDYLMREKSFIARIASLSGMDDSESEEYLEAYRAAEEEYSRLHLDSPADFIEYVMSLGEKVRSGLSKMYAANETFAGATESYRQARDGDEDAFYLAMKEESGKYAADFSGGDLDEVMEQLGAGMRYLQARKNGGLEGYMASARQQKAGVLSETIYLKPVGSRIDVNGKVIGVPSLYLYMLSTYGNAGGGDSGAEYGDGKALRENVKLIGEQAKDEASVDRAFSYALMLFEDTPSGMDHAVPSAFETAGKDGRPDAAESFCGMSSSVSELLSVLKEDLENLRDNLYITEYVMSNFSCLTSDAEQTTMTGVPVDPEHNRIYGCEAEYVIFGVKGLEEKKFLWFTAREAAGPEANIAEAKKYVYAVRLVFNSIFALTDASIDRMTLAPALSIQAATGGFFPYRLAQLTIKLALAMAESASDLKTLAAGGRVPLMKTASTWRFSVNGMIDALRERLTEEATNAAKKAVDETAGFLQELADGALDAANMGAEEIVNGIARDIETVLDSYLRDAAGTLADIVWSRSDKAFGEVFTEGDFDPEAFVDSIKNEIGSHIGGYDNEISTYLGDIWSLGGETLLGNIAGALSEAVADLNGGPDELMLLEETLYESVMGKISSHISSFLDRVSSGITGEVRRITSAAGEEIAVLIKEQGDRLTERLSKEIAEKTSGLFERYIPVKNSQEGKTVTKNVNGPGLDETIISFSYKDYLKLFLLIGLCGSRRNEALLRIADVIQLNVSLTHGMGSRFRMSEAYTYVEIKAGVQTRPLFLPYSTPFLKGEYHAISGY